MELNKFTTNLDWEEEGRWIDLDVKSKIRVARLGNKRYKDKFTELSKPYLTAIRNKTISDDVAEKMLAESLGHAILVDWENLTIGGEIVDYSKEKAVEILLDPKYKDFREMVLSIAQDMDVFKKSEEEDLVKNSQSS